ncbi:Rhodanese-related sulfurtransferase [Halobacillus alkaliphilus]|uniref:Rhodanese-related sulfurtransferase n=1 Tax=Halobacillus alkaliphilus TaxID=396056 RepID=A0A1I2TK84_9BACI|nr:rhodanese-like domain-containing protein [Halobacillus alkaliphilus]SFG64549.1 Rhodanese-related sulfurtransferase [Halobacillus alkaliphilus]
MAKTIQPEEVESKRKEKHIQVLDVRTNEEVAEGKIPEALHIPVDEIEERVGELDPNKEYITVCRSGRRSDMAADIMNDKGLNAHNMEGGMKAWTGDVR